MNIETSDEQQVVREVEGLKRSNLTGNREKIYV